MSVDVPGRHLPPLSFVRWAGDVAFPCCSRCWDAQWWQSNDGCARWWSLLAVVLQRVWVVAEDGGGSLERKALFVDAHSIFPANAAHAAQYKERMVAYMIYYVIAYVTLFCLCIRLDKL
jgi:hypothetical protein